MTAYVVFEALRDGPLTLETTITCSQLASMQPATRGGMVADAKMPQKIGYARWGKRTLRITRDNYSYHRQ
jgi:D-alanyl-D-alanine carboxypeptidase